MDKPHDYSFAPGAGETPPVLVGRENEKAAITRILGRLATGRSPRQNIALIGPRGNGKTALLRWTVTQSERCNDKINCAELTSSCFKSYRDLVRALAKSGNLSTLAGDGFPASVEFFGSKIEYSCQEAAKELLRPVLDRRCSKNGLAILIDEAHSLDRQPEVTRDFFDEVQALASKDRPLLLILAGTPDISTRLTAIEATYWNRLKKIGIGLLGIDAAREALRYPLVQMGYCIKDSVLNEAATAAQRYPYFIQVVGDALHGAAEANPDKLDNGKEIGDAIWNSALKEFDDTKNNYYADRYRELRRESILPAAETVARLFVSQKEKSTSAAAIEVAAARALNPKLEELARSAGWNEPAAWVEAELRHHGFIWSRIGHEHLCEPGIPSLMNYVTERAREREQAERRIREYGPKLHPS